MFNRKNFYILALAFPFIWAVLGQLIKVPEQSLAQTLQPSSLSTPTIKPSSSPTSTIKIIIQRSYDDKKYLQAAQIQLEADAMEKRHQQADFVLYFHLGVKIVALLAGLTTIGSGLCFIKKIKLEDFNKLIDEKIQKLKSNDSDKTLTEILVLLLYPGYFLCLIGGVLIIVSVFYNPVVSLQDERIYISDDVEPNPQVSP